MFLGKVWYDVTLENKKKMHIALLVCPYCREGWSAGLHSVSGFSVWRDGKKSQSF